MPRQNVIVVGAAVIAAGLPAGARADVIAHWKFDEAGGATAVDGVGAYYGTLQGGAAFAPNLGVKGGAVALDHATAGLVTMGDTLPLTGRDFTISAWARLAPGETGAAVIAAKHTTAGPSGYLLGANTVKDFGEPGRAVFCGSCGPGAEIVSQTSVNDGQWHHIVAVYHVGGDAEIYVDGAPVEAAGPAAPIVDTGAPLLVGGIWQFGVGAVNLFTGLVDDLQIYDHALICHEVQYLHDHPGVTVPDLCAANCDGDGDLDIDDFVCFQTMFALGAGAADCDCSAGLDIADFVCFQSAFAVGCP